MENALKSGQNTKEGARVSPHKQIRAFVGLGSNSSEAENMLARAREGLAGLPDLRLGAISPVYSTEPQGYADQPWFLNQVVELLPLPLWRPQSLLAAMLRLETALGRVRSPDPALRYGPRAIDADLLLCSGASPGHCASYSDCGRGCGALAVASGLQAGWQQNFSVTRPAPLCYPGNRPQ